MNSPPALETPPYEKNILDTLFVPLFYELKLWSFFLENTSFWGQNTEDFEQSQHLLARTHRFCSNLKHPEIGQ